jgi:hypothetical protein
MTTKQQLKGKKNKMSLDEIIEHERETKRLTKIAEAEEQQRKFVIEEEERKRVAIENRGYEDVPLLQMGENKEDRQIILAKGIRAECAKFAELFVWNKRDVIKECKIVGDLKALFEPFYLNYIKVKYQQHSSDWFETNGKDASMMQSYREWYIWYEKISRAPQYNILWRFLKQVTFEKCLYALSVSSGTYITSFKSQEKVFGEELFKSGFLKVVNMKQMGDQAKLIWMPDDINNYKGSRYCFIEYKTPRDENEYYSD